MAKKTKKKKKAVKRAVTKHVKRAHTHAKKHAAPKAKKSRTAEKFKKATSGARKTLLSRGKERSRVDALITLGRERGYITYDEILREFPTIEDNVLLLEEMYERFSAAGIDVLEGGGMLEDNSADTVLEKKKLQHRRADAGFDSVQMYLREIGQYPLLNGNQEKELASAFSWKMTKRVAFSHAPTSVSSFPSQRSM